MTKYIISFFVLFFALGVVGIVRKQKKLAIIMFSIDILMVVLFLFAVFFLVPDTW